MHPQGQHEHASQVRGQASFIVQKIVLCLLQNYVRNLIDFDISVVGHLENFDMIQQYLDQGDNVVCVANHQTEADPGAHSTCLMGPLSDATSSQAAPS